MNDPLVLSIQQRIQSWFSKAKATTTNAERGLADVPDGIRMQLAQRIQQLSAPAAYQTAVQEAIASAVDQWQQNPETPNHLVILGSPVEAIAQILDDSLQNWQDPPLPPTILRKCRFRPDDPLTLIQHIQDAIAPYQIESAPVDGSADDVESSDSSDGPKALLVIPCLEQCMLRCIGGWNSVEYIRDVAVTNPQYFWVIGCNHWAWTFLDYVCQISAYFDDVCPLPSLDGEALHDWLDPLAQTVVEIQAADQTDQERRQSYWDDLAKNALGISTISAQLWLHSLRIDESDVEEAQKISADQTDALSDRSIVLHESRPTLPSLGSITPINRYLLHSLLIHGEMTRAHLALSLGESESFVQSSIQVLLRRQILEQSRGMLSIHAVHYPKLKTELANNNFLVADED